jgi:hypothetical protein
MRYKRQCAVLVYDTPAKSPGSLFPLARMTSRSGRAIKHAVFRSLHLVMLSGYTSDGYSPQIPSETMYDSMIHHTDGCPWWSSMPLSGRDIARMYGSLGASS